MLRFYMEVVTRPDPYSAVAHLLPKGEQTYKINKTANTELEARKAAMEQVWANNCLVSAFKNVQGVPK